MSNKIQKTILKNREMLKTSMICACSHYFTQYWRNKFLKFSIVHSFATARTIERVNKDFFIWHLDVNSFRYWEFSVINCVGSENIRSRSSQHKLAQKSRADPTLCKRINLDQARPEMFLFTLLDQDFFHQLPSIMLRQTLLILIKIQFFPSNLTES